MGLKEKLDLIESAKNDIRNKIIDKGVYVPESTPFKDYPNYINNISAVQIEVNEPKEWTPDPLWWDIETILANDTNEGDYAWIDEQCLYKTIVLLDDYDVTTGFNIQNNTNENSFCAVKTSDGKLYTYNEGGRVVYHEWDRTKDKQSSCADTKTRYAILYKKYDHTIYYENGGNIWGQRALYIISNMTKKISYNALPLLQGIKLASFLEDCSDNNLPMLKFLKAKMNRDNSNSYSKYSFSHHVFKYANDMDVYKYDAENYESIDENGHKTYYACYDGESGSYYKQKLLVDISEIDFSTAKVIFGRNKSKFHIRGFIGVLDMSANTTTTDFDMLNDFASFELLSLILPPDADVKLSTISELNYASLKFLVENAPIITNSHTLTIPTKTYRKLKFMDKDYQISYNGQTYSDGVQVLTLKGWTVGTV